MSSKKKLEQRKEFKEYLSIVDKRVLDIKKSGIELIADDEVFVLVNGTSNYWISNHGRLVNNPIFSCNVYAKTGSISIQRNRNVATPKRDTLFSQLVENKNINSLPTIWRLV